MPRPSRWIALFLEFIADLRIASKEVVSEDDAGVRLELWQSQRRVLHEIAAGLDRGVRIFFILKSRQLGITTISLAITLCWLAMHKNLRGALVSDTEKNRDVNRGTIELYVKSFPPDYFGDSFKILKANRQFISFSNGSRLDLLVAGTRNKGTSWGEGVGYAFAHLTEVAAYGSADALDSFEESFAQQNPNRLFVYESTAKGFNHWRGRYKSAEEDPHTKCAIFVGWWGGDTNIIPRSDPRFAIFGLAAPNAEEREKIAQVAERFGHEITAEQLAWYRWKSDDEAKSGSMLEQNQPWLPEDAFVQTGFSFFQIRMINVDMKMIDEGDPQIFGYHAYAYTLGNDIFTTSVREITDQSESRYIQLRVWEYPVEGGQYVIGCDPAFGRNDHKDRHAIEVWRCYADCLVQVAEFASNEMEVKHAAWILAHLAGSYRDCMLNIELGGPGRSIMTEWDHIRAMMNAEMYQPKVSDRDWEDVLGTARWYLYHRPDSFGAGYAANFECLSLDTPLPTPTGWTTMGDVRQGDYLLSDTGEPTRVIGASNIKPNAKCYEIEFDDGTKIVADENHWWKVARRHWKNGADKLRQTKQLEPGKFYIRSASPLALTDAHLPIDPYLLGVWLGDGFSASATVACGDQDVEEMVANIEACGQPTRRTRHRTCWNIRLFDGKARGEFLGKLRALKVLGNKHIPAAYLRASYDQRLALLQGLMDTDGSASSNGGAQCEFVTTIPALVDGFSELVRSLGFKAKHLSLDESAAHGRICATRHQFWFTPFDMPVFRLQRKLARLRAVESKKVYRPCHRIVSIKEVESVPVRCVMVDGPTKMYLAGEGMIPTHNTTWRTKQEIMHEMRGNYVTRSLMIRSIPLLEEMCVVVQEGSEIGAPESSSEDCKDDRVFATALANRAWINWRRPALMSEGMTYERVRAIETGEATPTGEAVNRIVSQFFKTADERAEMAAAGGRPVPRWRQERNL